jgi:hypothetical protein
MFSRTRLLKGFHMKTDPLCKYCIISQQDIDFLAVQGMDSGETAGAEGGEAPDERPV